MNKVRLIGLGVGILLILAAFGIVLWQGMNMPLTSVAFAQGGTTATPPPSGSTTPPAQQQQQNIGDTFWGILAGSLGVNADDLKSKAVAARQQMIDQAVTDGRITQAQGDALKQRINSNNIVSPIPLPFGQGNGQQPFPFRGGPGPVRGPNGGFGGFGGGLAFGGGDRLAELTAVAKALNLDPKTLVQDLSQNKTLADIAQAQNVDQATVKQAMIDTRSAQIDQLLSLGLISQAQADQAKANLTADKIDLTRPFLFGFGGGRGFGPRGFGRGFGQQPPQNGGAQPTPAPTQTQ